LRIIFNKAENDGLQANNPTNPTAFGSIQVLISVSKRHFKHAVDRNRAKRQIREAWRLNRDILAPLFPSLSSQRELQEEESASSPIPSASLHLAFIWLSDEPQSTELVQRKMKNLLHRISEQLGTTTD